MSKQRIVVTGMGVVSCFGDDVDNFHQQLLLGKSGVVPIENFSCEGLSTNFAAVIKDFNAANYLEKKQARRVDRSIAFSLVAGKKALKDAGIDKDNLDQFDKTRCGVIIGSGIGGMDSFYDGVSTLNQRGPKKLSPFFVPFMLTNMGGAMLAMEYGFLGPNYSVSTACATSNYAIHSAAEHIRRGEADLIVCGGVEASISLVGMAGFCAVRALSQRTDDPQGASRPWDKNRDGFVMGEGAGVIVLETLESAKARGAPIYAEYLGGGLSCDAHHMTEPHPEGKGIILSVQNALKDAEISADEVDFINAHATSTVAGDMAEIRALEKIIPDPKKVAINATKSMIGHCLGAAGGLEIVETVKSLQTGDVHGTINLEDPEDIPFHVPRKAENLNPKVAMKNSFGFGGHNATLLFKKAEL